MVPLAPPVDLDSSVPHQYLADDPARDLVARDHWRPLVAVAVGLPFQLETEGHPVAVALAVHLGGIIEREREGFEVTDHALVRLLDHMVGPQAVVSDLERHGAGRDRDLVLDHGDQRAARLHQTRPVQDGAEVGGEADADVPADRPIRREPVQVVGLVPELDVGIWRGALRRPVGSQARQAPSLMGSGAPAGSTCGAPRRPGWPTGCPHRNPAPPAGHRPAGEHPGERSSRAGRRRRRSRRTGGGT